MFKISGKFRKEFRRTFGLWCCEERRFSRRRRHTSTIHTGGSAYICRYTTGGSTSYTARTEIMPLSALTSTVTIADVDWRPSMWDPEEKLEKKKEHRLCTWIILPSTEILRSCRKNFDAASFLKIEADCGQYWSVSFFFLWRSSPTRAKAASFLMFLDHTQCHITVSRTPRDLYLTTHNWCVSKAPQYINYAVLYVFWKCMMALL